MPGDDGPGTGGSGSTGPGPDDSDLLDALGVIVALEAEMPDSVAEAARALHDWSRVDAELAEMVEADPALTRHAAAPLAWRTAELEVQVEVRAPGWQRRALEGEVDVLAGDGDAGGPAVAVRVEVQTADGTTHPAAIDDLGSFEVEVPAGTVRLVVRHGGHALVTPWFTV